MVRTLTRVRGLLAVLAIVAVIVGCSTNRTPDAIPMRAALVTGNGLRQNGLTTNGLVDNGFWANGFWANGFWANGFWANGFWANGLTPEDVARRDMLRTNPYARDLLQYIYSCAMPATTYDATLDPNEDAPLVCGSDSDCDVGYACSAEGTCVIPLQGGGANGSGLAINADGTTWWGHPAPGGATDLATGKWGQCDETCQRWISACVLARTNAYGVHIPISMRAPADAPAPIRAALATTPGERTAFTRREGAFYGNIFATTPIDATTGLPAAPGTNGPATGPIASTPQFVACAGPDSNIPAITKRFCSSQGDQVVIKVPGSCLPSEAGVGTCAGQDADENGAVHACHTTAQAQPIAACPTFPDHLDPGCYNEVLTVYLNTPLSVCGNNICENDDSLAIPETALNCPSDCHPGTWARHVYPFGLYNEQGSSSSRYVFQSSGVALAPDDTIVTINPAGGDTEVEGISLPYGSEGPNVMVMYRPDGTLLRAFRFRIDDYMSLVQSLGVAPNGDIIVSGQNDYRCVRASRLWFARFSMTGEKIDEWNECNDHVLFIQATRLLAVDSAGNALTAGYFNCGSDPECHYGPENSSGLWVGKWSGSADHHRMWMAAYAGERQDLGTPLTKYPTAIANDALNNALIAFRWGEEAHLEKLSPDGTPLWHVNGGTDVAFTAVAADADGNVYVSGYFQEGHDFGRGPESPVTGLPPFLVKYDPRGAFQWVTYPQIICPSWLPTCGGSFDQLDIDRDRVEGQSINFDPAGHVVLGSFGNPVVGGEIDFGKGRFPTYSSKNIFLSAYDRTTGATVWAKQINTVVGSTLIDFKVDRQARAVVAGMFSGSVEIDDHLLVAEVPESATAVETFLASFSTPSPADHSGPEIATAIDANGVRFGTKPHDMVLQATGPEGATVFYTQPTALDGEVDGKYAGVSVTCAPRPNTTFPLGTTPVTCTASDPLGNTSSSATFTVTVVDRVGPVLSPVPLLPAVSATGPGTPVAYAAPTAIDQVDGPRPVACVPASGSAFAPGATTVTCTSSDTRGNSSRASFTVTVVDRTPPTLTLPGRIAATATCADGAVVTYSATAYDAVDGAITPVCTPPSGARFPLGRTIVNCAATDAAGNRTTGSFPVTVEYAWSGILPPIDANGESVFKLGSTVPVKFMLTGASATITQAVAKLTVTKVSSAVSGDDIEAVSTAAATTGNLFRYGDGVYVFNLSTRPLSVGTRRLSIDLRDGVSRTVLISLRR